jgi:hypothetical protein
VAYLFRITALHFLPRFCSQILSFLVSIHILDALSRRLMFQRWEQSLTWSVERRLHMLIMKLTIKKSKSPEAHLLEGCKNRRKTCQRYSRPTITCSNPSKSFPYCMLHACSLLLSHRMRFQCAFSDFYSIFSLCLLWTCSMSSNLVSGRQYLLTCWGSYSLQEDQQSKVSTGGKFEFILQLLTVLIYITDTGMYPHSEGEQ